MGGRPRARKSERAVYAARRKAARPAAVVFGEKGCLLVSMCQTASVNLRAMSIWAIFAPRWRPSRRLVCW
jgi:hypothetical protein